MEFIVKNSTANEICIYDLGFVLEAGEERDLLEETTTVELRSSTDLSDLINSGELVVMRNGSELPSDEGLDRLNFDLVKFEEASTLPSAERFRTVVLDSSEQCGLFICSSNSVWVQLIGL